LHNPAFAGAVAGHQPTSEETEHRSDVNDAPAPGLQSLASRGTDSHRSIQVNIDDVAKDFGPMFITAPNNARTIHDNIKFSDACHSVDNGGRVSDVQCLKIDSGRLVAIFRRDDFGFTRTCRGHMIACNREGGGNGGTNSTSTTRNEYVASGNGHSLFSKWCPTAPETIHFV
jgi:hypothetical protein